MSAGGVVEGTGYAPVTAEDDLADAIPLFDVEDVEFFMRPFVRGRRRRASQ